MFYPYVSERAIGKVVDVLNSKYIGQGPLIPKFEGQFKNKYGAKYAVAVNSCTSAIHLCYILAGVEEGDEVVGPLLTCPAAWHPLLWLKAKPVFCDIQDDFTIDPDDIERKITPKTKAIMVMHYGGAVCDMDRIMEIARKHKLPVIEDVAQAIGAKYKGKYAGTIGDYGCFSFQAIKHVTSVDGGMITCKKKKDYEKAKRIRWFGIDRDLKIKRNWRQYENWERREMTYDISEVGYKCHTNNLNVAIGIENLKDSDDVLAYYEKIDNAYREHLKNIEGLELIPKKKGDVSWMFTVLVDNKDRFAKKLEEAGVETNSVHVRHDLYTIFKPYVKGKFPTMDKMEPKYLCLPIHTKMTEEDVEYISSMIKYGW